MHRLVLLLKGVVDLRPKKAPKQIMQYMLTHNAHVHQAAKHCSATQLLHFLSQGSQLYKEGTTAVNKPSMCNGRGADVPLEAARCRAVLPLEFWTSQSQEGAATRASTALACPLAAALCRAVDPF